jgi:subtilisin family serine protease
MQPFGAANPPPAPPRTLIGANPPGPPPLPPWSAQPPPAQGPRILLAVATVLVGCWIVAATAGVQVVGWFVGEILLGAEQPTPLWLGPATAWLNAALVAAPAGLIWALAHRFTPDMTGVRAAARTWTVGALAAALLGLSQAVPILHNELRLLLTAIVALASTPLIRRLIPQSADRAENPVVFALAAGLLALLAWLWTGALGGLTETVLAIVAAFSVAWLAATLLNGAFFVAYGRSKVWMILVGGPAAGVALAPIGASVGGHGVNLAVMVVLPALSLAAAALAAAQRPVPIGRRSIAVLLGAGIVGPLAFVDPEETSLILGTADVGSWALVASMLSVPLALLGGLAYGLALSPTRRLKCWVPATAALVVAVAAVGVYAGAGHPGLYGDRLFVVLADQADLSGLDAIADRPTRLRETYQRLVQHAERTQAPLRNSLDRFRLSYTPYYLVNAIEVDGGPAVREWLSTRSDVDRVLLDQRLRPLPEPLPVEHGTAPAPGARPQWNIQLIQADQVWSRFADQGAGIVIGTSDSGVDGSHPALRDSFRGGDDSWYDPWNDTSTPTDHGGHGTHTIGTALGQGGIGVAPQAQWIGCVNLDRNLGSPSRYLDCLQFMLAPFPHGGNPFRDGHPDRAPHVLTNSWGCPDLEGCDLAALRPATAALHAAGIFVVAAAGNSGPSCSSIIDPPAPYKDVFTVGAVDRDRQVTNFSSRGPTVDGLVKPDVVAPGAEVLSSLPGGTYEEFAGTSMATPHVAGVVALMWSANPRLIGDVDTTAKILRDTAGPATTSGIGCGAKANSTGTGLVNAFAAVQAARAVR